MKATPVYLAVFLIVFGFFIMSSSASAQVACASAHPELGFTDFELGPVSARIGGSPTETVIRGMQLQIQAIVFNCGLDRLPVSAKIEIFITRDGTLSTMINSWEMYSDQLTYPDNIADVVETVIRIPSTLPTGGYVLLFRVFAGVNDRNADNNSRTLPLTVTSGCVLQKLEDSDTCTPPSDGGRGTEPQPGPTSTFAAWPLSDTEIRVVLTNNATAQSTDFFQLCYRPKMDLSEFPPDRCGPIVGFPEVGNDLRVTITGLSPGKTYYFRYRQVFRDCTGNTCNPSWSVIVTWATTPTKITNIRPFNGAKGLEPNNAALEWEGGFTLGDPLSYVLYWKPVGAGPENTVTLNSRSFGLTGLTLGQTYEWRVESRTGLNFTAIVKGPTWRFTVTGPPHVPSNPIPAVGAGMVPTPTDLTWNGGGPTNDPIVYDLYIGKQLDANKCPLRDSDLQCVPVITTNGSTTIGNGVLGLSLTDTSTYYWKVVARNGNKIVHGPVWWFFTQGQSFQLSDTSRTATVAPKVAFSNSLIGNHLVVWQDRGTGVWDILGALVRGTDGAVLVQSIPINVNGTTNLRDRLGPAVASSGNNFLVTWYDARNGTNDIFGALVRASDGVILQNNIPISTAAGAQNTPSVAYDPGSNHYLVVWADSRNGNFDIYGTRVNASTGAVVDPAGILIANATRANGTVAVQQFPSVASGGGIFWVTWEDGRNSTSSNLIFGARVNASTGALLDAAGTGVFVGSTASPQKFPTSAYNGSQFLTVWQDQRNASLGNDWDIYGKLVTAPSSGAVTVGPLIPIARTRGPQQVPVVGFGLGNFFVVWEDMRDHLGCTSANNCDWNPYAAWVRPDGVVMDNLNIFLTRRPNAQRNPALSFGVSNYFTIWEDYWEGGTLNQPEIWGQGRGNANFFRPGLGDDMTPPSAPTNLQAAPASATQIDLSWSAATDNTNGVGVSSYFVFRNGSRIANTTNITYSDTNRTPNTTYTYSVIAVDGDGNESAQSSSVNATTRSDIDLVASSIGSSPSARAGNSITLTEVLQNPGSGNAGAFAVKYYLSASGDPITSGTLLTTRSFSSGLAAGATFAEPFPLTIPAETAEGVYILSVVVDADSQVIEFDEDNNLLSLPITIDNTPPVINLTAPAAGASVCCTVALSANASDNVQPSSVVFLLDGNAIFTDVEMTDGWSATWNTLTATDGSHTLTAKAVDAAGNNTVSAAVTVQVYNPPVAPTGLSVADVAGDQGGALRLTWTVSTSPDITQQRIYRGTSSSGPFSLVTTIIGNTTSSYTNTGLTNGTTYYYMVRAYDGTTESGNSNVGSAIPRDNLAPTISNVASGSITTGGAMITWTTNEASDTQVEYGTTTSYGNSTTLNTSMVTSHSAAISGLLPSTLYHYRVKSRDPAGNLAASGDFTFTTTSPGGPDLNQLWVAISTITSSSITINDVVGNIGNMNAGAFDVGFYLSTDTSYQTTDTFLCKRSLSGLAAGTNNPPSGTASTICSISGIASGSYYLLAVADSGQVVAETNETNNTFSTGAPIGPDLIVSLISASKSSNTLTIQSAAKNQGNRDAGAFDLGFYLSTDTVLDTASDPFVCKRSIASLAVGMSDPPSSVTTTTCTLPAVPAGSYYVIGLADSTRVITEYNENNNTQIGASITVP